MTERIIIDTDPGQDDAFAILLALAAPGLEVLGLTTVGGNVPVSTTTGNARKIVELAGRAETLVHMGADRPLVRKPFHAEAVHGKTGLDGYDWPAVRRAADAGHAVDWMVETLTAARPRSVTLVPVGPLTNVAMALQRAPGIAEKISRIVLMGGGFFQGGNMSPAAEFNILVDPEAAAIVFGSGVPLVAVPIDCTYGSPTPVGWNHDLRAMGNRVGDACAGMLEFFERFGNAKYGTETRPLHDALAVGYLLWPELFSGRLCNVEIETMSPLTSGMTVVDWWGITDRKRNCLWLNRCDAPEFYRRMLATLRLLTP